MSTRPRIDVTARHFAVIGSIAAIVVATLVPFGALQTNRAPVPWCLACGGLWLKDGISNIVLFVPLGIALASLGMPWRRIAGLSLAGSLCIEYLQSRGLPPMRSAALADVATNALGGCAGVWLFSVRRMVFGGSHRVAAGLAITWTLITASALGLTSAALGPRSTAAAASRSDVRYRPSAFSYAPAYGWFSGMVDSAAVNGFATVHRGTGPVVIETSGEPSTLEMTVTLRGRQDGAWLKPMLFLHRTADTAAIAFVGERDRDAVLVVTRRAWGWGVAMPSLTLRNAFAHRTVTDERPVRVSASASSTRLVLEAHAADFDGRAALALTPTLGWAMLQTVITVDSSFAALARASWLALLVLPIGWWGARAGRRWWVVVGIATSCLAAFLGMLPSVSGVAPVSALDGLTMLLLLVAAAVLSRWQVSRARPA